MEEITPQLTYFLENNKNKKVSFSLKCEMGMNEMVKNEKGENEVIVKKKKVFFTSTTEINIDGSDVEGILEDMKKTILDGVSNLQSTASGWFF